MKPRGMIIGEAWGEEEERLRLPFVGAAGHFLNECLEDVGLNRSDFYCTNVFNFRPYPRGDITAIMIGKDDGEISGFPVYSKGNYLPQALYPELQRLWAEIREHKPNLIIALGATAVWALTGTAGIRAVRGTQLASVYPAGFKILPTYHPSAVLRDYALRPTVIADLLKAKRELDFPEIRRPERFVWLEPSLNHIELFYRNYVQKTTRLSFDIETAGKQITCIGFSPTAKQAIVIPFTDQSKPSGSYWNSSIEERLAWRWVAKYLAHSGSEKSGQNTLYDINWLWTLLKIRPVNYMQDTMLKHHALQPEMEKSLGFLGSIYTDEPAWKTMRTRGMFTTKRGE